MPKQLINLTLLVAIEEVENFLNDLYLAKLFCIPDLKLNITLSELRQKLIDYAINKIPNRYKVIDWVQDQPAAVNYPYCSLEQRLHIESLFHDVIVEILPETMMLPYCMQYRSNRDAAEASSPAIKIH